ncbi:LysM peptidoglycan-binding domain-containing protein [Psychrobacter sp. APC 3281]|jgi:LysM repeat protein|uniref:SPOR and LysM peptidoglycan-binding domain-containing protein n=1 Tax=Psychrobacter sp. APC 3281 TaxID=3035190 RepID=UPI0025B4FE4C|nr:LysM peptidoglycan-binding domain-containing protein [Psychrobacter sp. APC 3281]MDN3448116.1 LysM peptidoglycan-binding domain-containing protein [Psychrobacter sp. APC 3281]
MNFSRQALLGIGMIIGGSVMLYAMVQQIGDSDQPEPMSAMVDKLSSEQESPQPLTTDIETEKRILAQKQKERAARVAEQEKRAKEFLTEQEVAEAEALAKARAESQQYVDNSAPATDETSSTESTKDVTADLTVQPRTESQSTTDTTKSSEAEKQKAAQEQQEAQRQAAIKEQAAAKKLAESKKQAEAEKLAEAKKQAEAQAAAERKREAAEAAKNEPPKSPSEYQIKKGDGLIKLARQYNMPVEVLAQANNLSPSAALQLGQSITIPSSKQVQRLEREAAAAEQAREKKRQQEEALAKKSADAKREAQQKLSEARKEVKETDAKGSFGVQVALANDQAKADELAKKFRAAGYQVKTSATSRGVRVVVGPERGKVAALALKDKINSDPKVNTTSAWVLYWR